MSKTSNEKEQESEVRTFSITVRAEQGNKNLCCYFDVVVILFLLRMALRRNLVIAIEAT